MRREYSRLPFLLSLSFCSILLSPLSTDGLAGSFVKCLETKLYWQPLTERVSAYVDASHFDSAAISLSAGEPYNSKSLNRGGGNAESGLATFLAASFEWDTFIPRFQVRVKELSAGKAELISIPAEEAGSEISRSDVRYFKLIRHTQRGTNEKIVMLTRDGFTIQPKSASNASAKTQSPSTRRVDPRSLARAARRTSVVPIAKGIAPEYSRVSSEGAEKFWSPLLRLPENPIGGSPKEKLAIDDAKQFDAAALSMDWGKSYSVTALKDQNYEDEAAKSTFRRVSDQWDQFVPKFQDRLRQLSKGKSELIPITSKEAGVSISGYGLFFKLIRQTSRGPQEDIVWLTSEGFDILAKAKPSR